MAAQIALEKSRKDNVKAAQELDKAIEEKIDIDRAINQKQIEPIRHQFEDEQKRLSMRKNALVRGQAQLTALIATPPPQILSDSNRLQDAVKRLEDEIKSAAKQRRASVWNFDQNQDRLRQLNQDALGHTEGVDRSRRLTDDLRRRSQDMRGNIAELERKSAILASRVRDQQTKGTARPPSLKRNTEQ